MIDSLTKNCYPMEMQIETITIKNLSIFGRKFLSFLPFLLPWLLILILV